MCIAKLAVQHSVRMSKTRTIKVAPSVQGFNQVEVGDMIVLEVTRAVAVNVKPV